MGWFAVYFSGKAGLGRTTNIALVCNKKKNTCGANSKDQVEGFQASASD